MNGNDTRRGKTVDKVMEERKEKDRLLARTPDAYQKDSKLRANVDAFCEHHERCDFFGLTPERQQLLVDEFDMRKKLDPLIKKKDQASKELEEAKDSFKAYPGKMKRGETEQREKEIVNLRNNLKTAQLDIKEYDAEDNQRIFRPAYEPLIGKPKKKSRQLLIETWRAAKEALEESSSGQ
jgi:hypothetical protein